MKLLTSLITVKNTQSNLPRSSFPADDIEQAAQAILDAEGIINPIVVKRTGIESYEVIAGHFEYYAAVRAREINPRQGEMISAYIVGSDKEVAVKTQIELLRNTPKVSSTSTSESSSPAQTGDFKEQLHNFETYVNQRLQDFKEAQTQNQQFIKKELEQFEQNLPKVTKPIDIFNKDEIVDLVQKLRAGSFSEKQANDAAKAIITERKKKPFSSLGDVIERVKIKQKTRTVRAITEKKMVELISSWSNILFV